ncbi:MAG TPA: TlpA family protein disulfide reductase [Cytophagaceae bacterium]|jgi:thiol-disulfide isomerase/thioredoxin
MMKALTLLIVLAVVPYFAQSQTSKKVPGIQVSNLEGDKTLVTEHINKEGLTIINFWATWCKPCIQELDNIQKVYPNWEKETNVKMMAMSIDEARSAVRVGPLVENKEWSFGVFLDTSNELRKALEIDNIPHTYVLNKKGEIIWEHDSYVEGDEDKLYDFLVKESKKDKLVSEF